MFRLILLHPMKLAILSATEHTYFGINMTDLTKFMTWPYHSVFPRAGCKPKISPSRSCSS